MTNLRPVEQADSHSAPAGPLIELFQSEYEPMIRLAYVMLASQEDAEEVVQDAFLAVQARWMTLLNPGGYLRTAVVNGCRQRAKRQQRRPVLEAWSGEREWATEQPEFLLDALHQLPDRQRIAIVLAYYARMTSNEIATAMDCRPGTAKSLVHRGLARLRRNLER